MNINMLVGTGTNSLQSANKVITGVNNNGVIVGDVKKTSVQNPSTEDVQMKLRDLRDEVKQYNNAHNEYADIFSENKNKYGYELDTMTKTYEDIYEKISKEEISDKEREIKYAALEDTFKGNINFLGTRKQGVIVSFEARLSKESEKFLNDNLEGGRRRYLGNQKTVILSAIRDVSQQLLDYYATGNNKNGVSFSDYVKNGKDATAKELRDKFAQVSDIDSVGDVGSYMDFNRKYEIPSGYNRDEERAKNKEFRDQFSGYKRIAEKYNIDNQFVDIEI